MTIIKDLLCGWRLGRAFYFLERRRFSDAAEILELVCYESGSRLLRPVGRDADHPDGEAFIALGQCYANMGRHDEAIAVFSHVHEEHAAVSVAYPVGATQQRKLVEFLNDYAGSLEAIGKTAEAHAMRVEAKSVHRGS